MLLNRLYAYLLGHTLASLADTVIACIRITDTSAIAARSDFGRTFTFGFHAEQVLGVSTRRTSWTRSILVHVVLKYLFYNEKVRLFTVYMLLKPSELRHGRNGSI